MTAPVAPEDDAARQALERLVDCIDESVAELTLARARADLLLEGRRGGTPWAGLVTDEPRPLVVETVSSVLSALATAGHGWRREEAAALRREGVSINRIAALFGVTRQRISALLRE
ncbi:hypothetical protein [Blastococcus xanthinilyticus]|uniref:Homeodomain-like domain-containing protein n=1 Tax=Blastococcus xanthinilyticus TaxID=1564164 RepID=A0A5S5CVR9_9ACTN|nr:hypothetical protein [Blastococcus xanthinilyticus]TYP87833.1 hypothetical protein BD833_1053 [Blastococcus xanthinilyticus]